MVHMWGESKACSSFQWPKWSNLAEKGTKMAFGWMFFFFAFVCTFFGFGGLKMGDFFLVPLQAFYCISMSRRWKLKQMRPNTKFQKLRLSPQWLLMALFSMVAVSFSNSKYSTFQFFHFTKKKGTSVANCLIYIIRFTVRRTVT